MGKSKLSKEITGATGRRIFFFLLVCSHLVTSERSDEAEASPSPLSSPPHDPESLTLSLPYSLFNSFAGHPITLADDTCAVSPPPQPPQHEINGNLHPRIGITGDQPEATFADAIALTLLTSRMGRLPPSMMIFMLTALWVGLAAVCRNEVPLRIMLPGYAQVPQRLCIAVAVISFNALMAFLLPLEFLWVPAVCAGLSLSFIVAAWTS